MPTATVTLSCLCYMLPVLVAVSGVEYSHTIYVDPVNGSNTKACLTDNDASQPCRNLSYAFQYRNHSTQYLLHPGTHYLNSIASDSPFTDLEEVAIRGMGSGPEDTEVVCSTANAGLAFINTTNISLEMVTYSNCSALHNSTSRNYSSSEFALSTAKVALYFSLCANVSMDSVHVTDSLNASGVTMYNTVGYNTIHKCNFTHNGNPNLETCDGGGGVYVEFSYCLPGNTGCENGTKEAYTDQNKDSRYTFGECNFSFNNAQMYYVKYNQTYGVPFRENHVGFGRGGGLLIFFNGNASNNTFTISDCTFSENQAQWGAGMFVAFRDTSSNNTVLINGNTFAKNNCTGNDGGGLRVGQHTYRSATINQVKINDCNFSENVAENGGGGGVFISAGRQKASELPVVSLNGTTFTSNHASIGAALNIELFSLIVEGDKPHVSITDCYFTGNSLYPDTYKRPYEVGIGTVYISDVPVQFRGTIVFLGNTGTALAAVAAQIDFMNSTADFIANIGLKGAAIALLGSSTIVINESSVLHFLYNTASIEGGAIYSTFNDRNKFQDTTNCFIVHYNPMLQPDDWKAKFHFTDNYVSDSTPNAIYSTSVYPCTFVMDKSAKKKNINSTFCWKGWHYNSGRDCQNFIRTGPGMVTAGKKEVFAYPGEKFSLSLNELDDFNHPLSIVYSATSGALNETSFNATIDPQYEYVSNDYMKLHGKIGTEFILDLDSVGETSWHVQMKVLLKHCPPGLVLQNSALCSVDKCNTSGGAVCECNKDHTYNNLVRCNSHANASLTSKYWMGIIDGGLIVVADCPPGFCLQGSNEFLYLPNSTDDLNNHICGPQHRKGEVCGECLPGYGVAINSDTYECVMCNITGPYIALHATYYILSVYVPLCIMFLAILAFKINLTIGSANSFILFSQVISSTFDLDAGGKIPLNSTIKHSNRYLLAYKFPYGIFNLEFFEQFIPPQSLCLGTSLNTLDIFLLDYIVAFFPLLMILAVVLFYKLKDCCCFNKTLIKQKKQCKGIPKKLGDALVPAFATYILLSYVKFSLTSSYLVVPTAYHNTTGEIVGQHAYFAGQYPVHDRKYIVLYYMPAIIVFLTFVAIPPLVLLDYPLRWFEMALRRVPRLWRHYPKDKVHIILDAFQGCYKNKWRFFAGLYFIFRLLINVTYVNTFTYMQLSLQAVYCVVFALLVAFLKPYKMEYHLFNYVDSLIFLNLAIINQTIAYNYGYTRSGATPSIAVFIIQYILVFLPLVYMIMYVLWSVLPIPKLRVRVKEWLRKKQMQQLESLIQNYQSATSEDVDWERARDINSYSPTPQADSRDSSPPPPVQQVQAELESSGLRNSSSGRNEYRSYGSIQ